MPVLVDGATVVPGSLEILDWIEAGFPEPPLQPRDAVGREQARTVYERVNRLMPLVPRILRGTPEEQDAARRAVRAALEDLEGEADGLWFQAVEAAHGMEAAIEADRAAWERSTVVEARRIMDRLGMAPGGGIPALLECLKQRLYARLNEQEAVEVTAERAVFRMVECRVRAARRRKGLLDFPCKAVGIVEYEEFAKAIDPRIRTRCIACPPDPGERDFACAWEFTLG